MSRAMSGPARLRLVRLAHQCVVFGIDPGKISGAAIVVRGEVSSSGVVLEGEHSSWVEAAVTVAHVEQLPLVAAVETWTSHGRWGFQAALGLGERAGRWLGELERQNVYAVVRPQVMEWRRDVFGGGQNVKTEVWDQRAKMHARAATGTTAVDDNEADAICIALWGSRADAVAKAMRRAASSR